MTQHDDIEEMDRGGGTAFRWVARILIMACGLMIGLVVLSDPRVTGAAREALAQMQTGSGEEIVARQDTSALTEPARIAPPVAVTDAAAPEEAARPRVSVLPESRVNVIRLTD